MSPTNKNFQNVLQLQLKLAPDKEQASNMEWPTVHTIQLAPSTSHTKRYLARQSSGRGILRYQVDGCREDGQIEDTAGLPVCPRPSHQYSTNNTRGDRHTSRNRQTHHSLLAHLVLNQTL